MNKSNEKEFLWIDKNNKIISCEETNKVLNENFIEVSSFFRVLSTTQF